MLVRIVSALVGIALWLGFCFAGLGPFSVGIFLVTCIGVWEIVSEYRGALDQSNDPDLPNAPPTLNILIALTGLAMPVIAWRLSVTPGNGALNFSNALTLLIGVYCLLALRYNRSGRTLGGGLRLYGLLGPLYVGGLFSGLIALRGIPGKILVAPFGRADEGAWIVVFVAACVWATDTFAFLFGKSIGKHPLAPRLSPHKTVEGALGGLLGATLVGALWGSWIHLPLIDGFAVGAIAGSVGQVGDLFESALKREIGVKDFGRVMPGHGGILDRFDSLIFVAPVAYMYLRLIAGI